MSTRDNPARSAENAPPSTGHQRGLGIWGALVLGWLGTRLIGVLAGLREPEPYESIPLRWIRVASDHPERLQIGFSAILWSLSPRKRLPEAACTTLGSEPVEATWGLGKGA